jgi:putative ABC transport system substrate-binding protein
MKRRDLLLWLAPALTATLRGSRAQQQRRVGFLSLASADAFTGLADYRRGLDESGYLEGRNLMIKYRWADGDFARLPGLAAELVRENVEVITTMGSPESAMAAAQATATIPIVGTSVAPLVVHFNRPEANVTGVSILTADLMPKRLQLLAEIVPGEIIGILVNPAYPAHDRDRTEIEDAARAVGVRLAFASASADPDFEPAFASLARQHVGAVLPEAEPFFGSRRQLLVTLAARYAVPMMHEWRESVLAGGLLSYAPQLAWIYHQVGLYTGQVLNGAKPGDLPVVAPTRIELVINLGTAKALGLTVPPSIFARADEVIE